MSSTIRKLPLSLSQEKSGLRFSKKLAYTHRGFVKFATIGNRVYYYYIVARSIIKDKYCRNLRFRKIEYDVLIDCIGKKDDTSLYKSILVPLNYIAPDHYQNYRVNRKKYINRCMIAYITHNPNLECDNIDPSSVLSYDNPFYNINEVVQKWRWFKLTKDGK